MLANMNKLAMSKTPTFGGVTVTGSEVHTRVYGANV